MRVYPPSYQNNHNWAINNKSKGLRSSYVAAAGTISGVVKACSNQDSKTYKVANFFEKLSSALSNRMQYYLFDRNDDVLEEDNLNSPIAATTGKVASFTEKYIEPIAKPASAFLEPSLEEASNDAMSFFDVLYWKIRFIFNKVNFKELKSIPLFIKSLFDQKIETKDKADITKNIVDISISFLASIGSFFVGAFTPIKIVLKLIDRENRIINALTACGKSAINILYFFKFTLEWLWKGSIKKDKSCHALFALGTTANALNVALPVIELLPKEDDGFLSKFYTGWKSLANNLLLLFWGLRRNKLGREWLEKN